MPYVITFKMDQSIYCVDITLDQNERLINVTIVVLSLKYDEKFKTNVSSLNFECIVIYM